MNVGTPLLILVTSASQMGHGKQTGLWLEEFAVPFNLFRQRGIPLCIASPMGGKVPIDPRSIPDDQQKEQWRDAIAALQDTLALQAVGERRCCGVFVPGGHGAMFDMPDNPLVAGALSRIWAQGGLVSAVCHGPAALIGARDEQGRPLVQGRRVSCFSNAEESEVGLDQAMPFLLESRLRELGAKIDNAGKFESRVVTDGRLITGQNPQSSLAVAEAVAQALLAADQAAGSPPDSTP